MLYSLIYLSGRMIFSQPDQNNNTNNQNNINNTSVIRRTTIANVYTKSTASNNKVLHIKYYALHTNKFK